VVFEVKWDWSDRDDAFPALSHGPVLTAEFHKAEVTDHGPGKGNSNTNLG